MDGGGAVIAAPAVAILSPLLAIKPAIGAAALTRYLADLLRNSGLE